MSKTTPLKILEMIWLIIGVIGIILFIYNIIKGQKGESIYFIVITFVSGLMYSLRRRQRKKIEKEYNDK